MRLPSSLRQVSLKLQIHQFKLPVSVRTSVTLAQKSSKSHKEHTIKKFHEIPGPMPLPFLGTSYLYLLGIYSGTHYRAGFKKYLKYGPIVREEFTPENVVVSVFHHDDMEHLFLSDNNEPKRQRHHAVDVFRESHSYMHNPGEFPSKNGEDWWKSRSEFQKGFSSPQVVRAYLPAINNMIQDFISYRLMQNTDDFLPELLRLSLQLTVLVAFGKNVNCFSSKEIKPDSMSSHIMQAIVTANRMIGFLENDTNPQDNHFLWKRFEKAMLHLEGVTVESLKVVADSLAKRKKTEAVSECDVPSLLELHLTSPNLDFNDVVGMTVDLLLSGVETTAFTASFALYHLAKNERVQNLLRSESQKVLKSPMDPVTYETLANVPYARAVLKEVFRMTPSSSGTSRIATQDLVLSGYHIPQGTTIVTQNQAACRLQKHFIRPNEFLPERWIKGSPLQVKDNPFLVLPFGHGSYSCIARPLAEQYLLSLILKIVRNSTIGWASEKKLDCKNPMYHPINQPDEELKFTFYGIH